MKKTIYGFLLGFIALFGVTMVSPVALATDNNWDDWFNNNGSSETNPLLSGNGMWLAWAWDSKGSSLLDAIRSFINWALGMLATVALVICLYAGFQMMTAGGDQAKFDKGTDMLKKAWIGLVIIGLAWMIVSVIMWLITNLTSSGSSTQTQIPA